MPLLILLRTSRTAQVIALALVAVLAFGIWLWVHDRSTRAAERARIEAQAIERAERATKAADEAQNAAEEAYNATRVDNAADAQSYLDELRRRQCASRPTACR